MMHFMTENPGLSLGIAFLALLFIIKSLKDDQRRREQQRQAPATLENELAETRKKLAAAQARIIELLDKK
jgi:hypothetical protein